MSDRTKHAAAASQATAPANPQAAPAAEPGSPTLGAAAALTARSVASGQEVLLQLRRLAPRQQHEALLALQRTAGNAAVQRLLTRSPSEAVGCGDRPSHGRDHRSAAPIGGDRRTGLPTLQRDDDEQRNREWTDLSRGLTKAQHGQLALTLRWTGNLRAVAVQPPRWDLMLAQCGQLQRDLGAVLNRQDLTSLARGTLGPALPATLQVTDLIHGAKEPLETVRTMVEGRLKEAGAGLDDLLKPVVVGGVTVSDRSEFDRLLDGARQSPDKRIPGTPIVVEDEADLRRRLEPLSDGAKAGVREFKGIVSRLVSEAERPQPALKAILDDLHNLMPSVDRFAADHNPSAGYQAPLAATQLTLKRAVEVLIGKLAPLENTLGRIRLLTSEVEGTINRTLALPLRHDPKVAGDDVPPAKLGRMPAPPES